MRFSSFVAIALATTLAGCEAPSNGASSSQNASGGSQVMVLTAQTDDATLVDACYRFIAEGTQLDLSGLGYSRSAFAAEVSYTKEVPNSFFASSDTIRRIEIEYITSRFGGRTCQLKHFGAGRDSGVRALLDDLGNRLRADGWVASGRRALSKDGRTITLTGRISTRNGASSSLISARLPSS